MLTDFSPHGNESEIPALWLTRVACDFGKYRRINISVLVVPGEDPSVVRSLLTSRKTWSQRVSITANAGPQRESAFPANGEVCRSFELHNHSPQNSQSEEA
ncbi:MAG: hypothetical protein NT138_05215 [Planctomycetales bacterium]|nr:hypothetical protein [Planctomycetales bacterium]